MKLIKKTQRIYILLIIVLLVIWGGAFLLFISSEISESVDETLGYELELILNDLEGLDVRPDNLINTPFLSITSIPQLIDTSTFYSDTMIVDLEDGEPEPFRQIQTQRVFNEQSYQVVLRQSQLEYDDLFFSILYAAIIFIGLLVSVMAVMNKKFLQQIWEPFYDTIHQLLTYKISDKVPIHFKNSDIDEFQQLNRALEQMLDHIEREYTKLKQFTENASHEMQTPLSVIQSQIEMLIQDESLSKDQLESLQMLNTTSVKLSRLNRALLLLTKIENEQYARLEPLNITKLLEKIIPEYQELAVSKEIKLTSKFEEEVIIQINPDLAEMLFRNLLSNAVKHNLPGGSIDISLTKNRFIITNSGPSIHMDTSALFNRFQKGEQSSESLGLGLSIVKTIVEASHLSVDYSFTDDKHTLTVNFV